MKWKFWNALNEALKSEEVLFFNTANKLPCWYVLWCPSTFKRQAECLLSSRLSLGMCLNKFIALFLLDFCTPMIHSAGYFQFFFFHSKIYILFNLNQKDKRPFGWHLRTSHLGNCIKFLIYFWNKAPGLFSRMYFNREKVDVGLPPCWTSHITIDAYFLFGNCWSQSPKKQRTELAWRLSNLLLYTLPIWDLGSLYLSKMKSVFSYCDLGIY